MQPTPAHIANIPSLSKVSSASAARLITQSSLKRCIADEVLAKHGNLAESLFYVVSGAINVLVMGDEGRLIGQSTAKAGDPIGWLSVVDGQPLTATLVSATASEVLVIPSSTARELLLTEPSVSQFVLKLFARGLRQHFEERRVLTLPSAFQRVFLHLYQLAQTTAKDGTPLLPKQQDIATTVNTSRETVSRAIQMLVKQGVLLKRGHQVVVIKHDQLKALATAPTATDLPDKAQKTRG